MKEKLALFGGTPIKETPWPSWPQASKKTKQYITDVLLSNRWSISGKYTGNPTFEQLFSTAFAKYNDLPHCISVNNGSAALVVALEALDVGFGDEVLVPGLTWPACASAVLRVGAIPILVDIDPTTLCISLDEAAKAKSHKTKAIIFVHLFGNITNLDELSSWARQHNISLIEDCSQAHGAEWRGKKAGTFGDFGIFSMQDSKILTCGEGGAIITNNDDLYEKIQQLRTDGRIYKENPEIGRIGLKQIGDYQGYNYCLSEFQSAVLLGQLEELDKKLNLQKKNILYFNNLLNKMDGITYFELDADVTKTSFYRYVIQINNNIFKCSTKAFQLALSAELGHHVNSIYSPLDKNKIYNPSKCLRLSKKQRQRASPTNFSLKNSQYIHETCLAIPHQFFLGSHNNIQNIIDAILKIQRCEKQLKNI